MNTRLMLLVAALLCSLSFSSCSYHFHGVGHKGALAKRQPASILVHEDDSGDETCLRAISHALHQRGFPVVRGQSAPLVVKMSDTWRWDWVMYLKELDLVILDSKTGVMKAHAYYHNSPWHRYPSREWVVQKLFHELDKQGVFEK